MYQMLYILLYYSKVIRIYKLQYVYYYLYITIYIHVCFY